MRTRLALTLGAAALPGPVLAAAGDYPFLSLYNTDIVVLIAFLLFVGILVYFKVPGILTGMLDKRAEGIRSDLDEARSLREEAQRVLADYERKSREVAEQADRIVARARDEAKAAAEAAKDDIARSVARRLAAAEDQIAAAEAAALRSVRNTAARVAVAAAGDVIAAQMTAERANALIDEGIARAEARLH